MTKIGSRALRLAATLTLLSSCFTVAQTAATVPTLVKFSGTVQAPRSRIIGMTFALYKDEQGGFPLWMETQSVQLDAIGRYTVQLGTTFPEGLPKELFASGEARWLGVQPEGQSEQQRVLLVSVPYALKAADAETIGGLPPSAFVLKDQKVVQGTAERNKASNLVSKNTPPPPGPPTNVTTSGGTVNTLPLFSTATDIENSVIAQSGTSIGINTTSPAATLDVNGTANVRGNLSSTLLVNAGSGYELGGYVFGLGSWALQNAFVGFAGNQFVTGSNNAALGASALMSNTTGGANAVLGAYALPFNTTGTSNIAIGHLALQGNTTGNQNTAVGEGTLYTNNGSRNTAVGHSAMFANTTGANNAALGYEVLESNTTGNYNSAIGFEALFHNTAGSSNNAIGNYALVNSTSGNDNTAVGDHALQYNTTGSTNTGLGFYAGTDSTTTNLSNATAIGAFADVQASNALVLGSIAGLNAASFDTNVGIGTPTPTAKLHVGSPSGGASTTSLRVEGPSQSGTGGRAASFGGWGDFGIDAPGIVNGRFLVKENGRVGIGTASPDNTLSVNGSADKTGGGSWGTFSDRRLKDLNGSYTSGLSEVLRINPVRYHYKDLNGMDIHDREEHVGLVAQEIQKVIPEAVTENSKGYLLVNNDPIIWAMLNAIKEQQQQIRKQRAQVRAQQAAITKLTSQLRETQTSLTKMKTQLQANQMSLVAAK